MQPVNWVSKTSASCTILSPCQEVRMMSEVSKSGFTLISLHSIGYSAPSVQCECRDSCVESLLPKVGLKLDLCNGSRSLEKLVDRSDRQEEDQGLWQVFWEHSFRLLRKRAGSTTKMNAFIFILASILLLLSRYWMSQGSTCPTAVWNMLHQPHQGSYLFVLGLEALLICLW